MSGIFNASIFNNAIFNTGGVVPPMPATEQFSGGYFDYGGQRRRTPEDLRRERERFGITTEAQRVISAVAAQQAERLELDAHKRFEELERELEAQQIEWRAEYLTALNAERERLITAEIAARLQAIQKQDELIVLALLAACV
jgi:hypothetical protein